MSRVYYNKLVRDGIPEKISENGDECETRVIKDELEFKQELLKKVAEEANELSRTGSRQEFLKEYTDLMIVLDALTKLEDISEAEVQISMKENLLRKGGFDNRLFLYWSSDSTYKQ